MKLVLSSLCLLLASGARASEGLPGFFAVHFPRPRAAASAAARPYSKPGDVLTSYHMLVQAGKDSLYGRADNAADAAEATAYWAGVLKGAGIETGAPTFADGIFQLPYKTADGRVLRDFLADSRQFPPKDDAGLRANMALTADALGNAGLDVVAARVLDVDSLLPTYSLLYLTRPDALPEHEARLRLLKAPDDLEFDVYRSAGVDVIQTPEKWMMVYAGPEVGYLSLFARTREELDAKAAKRRDFLAGEGKRLIDERRFFSDDPDFKFGAALYFFQ